MTRFDLWSRWVARTKRPILIGPWVEEIGSCALYWLPFVAQWQHRYRIPKDRLFAIARGGSALWHEAGHPVELFDYWPAEAIRLETLRRSQRSGSVKQASLSEMERTLYPTIAARLGLRRYHVLHPYAMYRAIRPWQVDQMSLAQVMQFLRFTEIPVPLLPLSLTLPEKFVCVRFYARATWPLSEEVRDYCGQLVGELAKHIPVVVIGSTVHHDDHLDLNVTGPNITSLVDVFPERDHLALQSAVIAKSQVFVGTYGGTMQLAVRLRKPSVGLYLNFKGTAYAHKVLTEWLALQQGTPIFIGTPQQGELVRSAISQSLELPQPAGSSSGVMA